MGIEFNLPDIGEGLAEGEIVKWLVSAGDDVEEDQPLVEVMTDKATVEIPSPRGGRVETLLVDEGAVVEIGTPILRFGDASADGGAADTDGGAERGAADAPDADHAFDEEIAAARERARAERSAAEKAGPAAAGGAGHPSIVLATPATRRLARELEIDLSRVSGSGKDGRVTKEDVQQFATSGRAATAAAGREEAAKATSAAGLEGGLEAGPAEARVPGTAAGPDESRVPAPVAGPAEAPEAGSARASEPAAAASFPAGSEPPPPIPAAGTGPASQGEERVPLRGLRRKIAERMVEAKSRVPHYTYVEEVDMTEVVMLREEAKPMAEDHGIRLTFLPFIIRALVIALKKHPYMNASFDEDAGEIVLKRHYDIGIATATDNGLMVPVIKGADALGVFELAAEIQRLAAAARDGSITVEELRGSTFTITSTGNIGGVLATPIINLPEVAILGVTAIRKRPVVRDDQIVVRQMMNLSVSLDHRVVDGAIAALFVKDLVKLLEDPKLQLLGSL